MAVNDTTQTWDCHHRGEILSCGRFQPNDLKKFGLYFNRPAAELIFLTKAEHTRLHKSGVPRPDLKGVPKSEDHKKALSEALKGVPKSEDHKKALSEALKGVPKSEATKQAMSEAHKGVTLSEEHKKAIGEARSKKILQFTKSGEFISEWQSAREAHRELGISQGNICACCNGKRKSAGGFIWRYA